MATEIQSLDLTRLLLGHAALSLVAALSTSPIWNFPLALYGLVVVGKSEATDGGDSVRQFTALMAASFVLDFFWQVSYDTAGLARFLLLVNWCLKPITLLAALGHLRQRGLSTFAVPGNIALPTSFSLPGSFPPQQSQTVWSAPPQDQYQPAPSYQAHAQPAQQQQGGFARPGQRLDGQSPPPPPPHASVGAEGGGYHTLE